MRVVLVIFLSIRSSYLRSEVRKIHSRSHSSFRADDRPTLMFRATNPPLRYVPPAMTSPVLFGEKTAWCTFRTTDVERVCEVLFKDKKPRRVSWEEGVDAAYHWPDIGDAKVLVTPAIDGFVLAMTQGWLGWWRGGDLIARANHIDGGNAGEITTRISEWHGDVDSTRFSSSPAIASTDSTGGGGIGSRRSNTISACSRDTRVNLSRAEVPSRTRSVRWPRPSTTTGRHLASRAPSRSRHASKTSAPRCLVVLRPGRSSSSAPGRQCDRRAVPRDRSRSCGCALERRPEHAR